MGYIHIINSYVFTALFASSFIVNLICCIVFIMILRSMRGRESGHMFKYLLIKSLCDMFSGFFNLLWPIYSCNHCEIRYSLFIEVWNIWFHEYLSNVLYMASAMFEISASFECAISIENKLKWCQKRLSFIIETLAIFVFCASLFSYKVFTNYIEKHTVEYVINGTKIIEYFYSAGQLIDYGVLIERMDYASIFLRDALVLIILIVINGFVLIKLIQIRRRKSHLQTSRSNTVIAAERAQNRKIKMILFIFMTFLFGHFPIAFFITIIDHIDYFKMHGFSKIYFLCYISFYISFSTPIIAYFFFNQKFKSIILEQFNRINIFNNNNNNNR
jgi:hypothetical protein